MKFYISLLCGLFVSFYSMATYNLRLVHHKEALCFADVHAEDGGIMPVVAVIDGGVAPGLPLLAERLWCNEAEISGNGVDDDGNGYVDDVHGWNFDAGTNDVFIGGSGNWHGTPVNTLIASLCPQAQLLNIVKGESVASIVESLEYVYYLRKLFNESNGSEGAFIVVVNCSWGKERLIPTDSPEWCAMYNKLGREGVLCVSSVPNENVDIDIHGDMPASCNSPYLITVTNSDSTDCKVTDAAYGLRSVDLAAPGDYSWTLLNTGDVGFFDGTSAAAPYVTATVAMLYTLLTPFSAIISPATTARIMKDCVLNGNDQVEKLDGITTTGGRLNMERSIMRLYQQMIENKQNELYQDQSLVVRIYPNPVTHDMAFAEIMSATEMSAQLYVYNADGLCIYRKSVHVAEGITTVSINLSKQRAGVYIVSLDTHSLCKTAKIVIQ